MASDREDQAIVRTTECPNCGRIFTGDYCPSCGQEANPSSSVGEVIGGFFRELVDLENGFGPTLVGLTLRPGQVLRRYLEGTRAGLATPGRYLLGAAILAIGTEELLTWTGISEDPFPPEFEARAPSSEAAPLAEAFVDVLFKATGQWIQLLGSQIEVLGGLLMAGLLAALLYRLFDSIKQGGEALALGCFLSAHVLLLTAGADLVREPVMYLRTGTPAKSSLLYAVLIQIGYVGFATYQGFGRNWRAALKGAFAGTWAFVEAVCIFFASLSAHAGWLVWRHPDTYAMVGNGASKLQGLLVGAGLFFLLPLLLHALVETYDRLQASEFLS